jgi:acetyltransferase-like isoleucine patch superfamily enzyme
MFRLFLINCVVSLVWIPRLRNLLLNLCGLNIHKTSKIGLSLILTKNIQLGKASNISHFNFLQCDSVILLDHSTIGKLNFFKGRFDVYMENNSHIGNSNILKNNGLRVIPKVSIFKLGKNSNITSSHYLDISCDITFGNNSVLAGRSSTLWTHGFVHFNKGGDRLIKLEDIYFGDGVYIGSNCIINPGTRVEDDVNIGSGTSVSGRLEEAGLYVNQKMRFINLGSLDTFLEHREYDSGYKTGNKRIHK